MTNTKTMKRSTRSFIRHYVEMVVVMFAGMAVLWVPAEAILHAAGSSSGAFSKSAPAGYLVAMATAMSIPMVGWMRWRGHGWQPSLEMAASMYVPTALAVGLLAAGAVTGTGTLLVIQHNLMLPAMLVAMLLRRDEYSHSHGTPALEVVR